MQQEQRKSDPGRKPHAVTLKINILVLQALYNLSDDLNEAQVRALVAFLGLSPDDDVPEAKTPWLFAASELVHRGALLMRKKGRGLIDSFLLDKRRCEVFFKHAGHQFET